MRRYLSVLGLAVWVSGASYAHAISFETVAVNASELLLSAHKLKAQTGPAYLVNGVVSCTEFAKEFPPYGAESACLVTLDGRSVSMDNPDKLIGEFKKIKPATGPAYSFDASFNASSITPMLPPYLANEKAEIIVGAFISSAEILEAARRLQIQTGPAYHVEGKLNCVEISQEVPPYGIEENCQVTIDNAAEELTTPSVVLAQLKDIKAKTGPYYSFETNFTATSISQEFPPYTTFDTVKLQLFK